MKRAKKQKNIALREELRAQRQVVFGNRRYWFHIAIWSLVIVYTFYMYHFSASGFNSGLRIGSEGHYSKLDTPMTISGIILGGLLSAVMTYFFLLIAIAYAHYKKQKRYILYGLGINGLVWIAALLLASLYAAYSKVASVETNPEPAFFVVYVAVFSLILSAYFFAIYYFIDLYDQQKTLARFEHVFTEKLRAETNFLKTQINPHFLFNTLNNIYSLTLSKSDDAPRITLQLKELISYMVNDCAQDEVPLTGEIAFLKNYIALEQLRNKQDHTTIELEVKGAAEGHQIAPLLLINFIENAFKHGVKAGIEASFVRVKLCMMDNVLAMDVTNSKPAATNAALAVAHQGGIGIGNVKRRLQLLYPGRHKLRINESGMAYHVHLNINL